MRVLPVVGEISTPGHGAFSLADLVTLLHLEIYSRLTGSKFHRCSTEEGFDEPGKPR